MGQRVMDGPSKKTSKKSGDGPIRRSQRIQAKPTPGLLAAKKSAQQRMGNKKEQPSFNLVNDIYQTAREAKDKVCLETGVVYDPKMLEHKCVWDENYPERPERLSSVLDRCEELGLLARCTKIDSRFVKEEEILRLHSPQLLSLLRSTQSSTDMEHLEAVSSNYDSVYIHPSTYECSLLSAGSAINLVNEICTGKVQNGMALIRPPGHHAMENELCGYCYLNNVALAANHALSLGLSRILVVDWDVHHGQATQQMFYKDPRVLYFSIHRYDHGTFWPNLRESNFDFIGEGNGKGFNVNVPLNSTNMGDADYMAIFNQLLLRIGYEFQPELVIVSAGYDAAIGCPEFSPELILVSAGFDSATGDEKGEMQVTPACYAHLVTTLMSLACGRVAVILEGGYCLKSLAESAALTLRALLGDPCPVLSSLGKPQESLMQTIFNVIYVLREYWKCFRYHKIFSLNEPEVDGQLRYIPVIKYENSEPKLNTYPTRDCYPVQDPLTIMKLNETLDQLISSTKLFSPPHRVCYVYDSKMMLHTNYEDSNHLEKPARISSVYRMYEDYNLLSRLHRVKSRMATEEEILYAHSKSHLEDMKSLTNMSKRELIEKKNFYLSVFLHHETFNAACLAAGSVLEVVDSVLRHESRSGVAIVRPPGHHADIDDPCGFCIFNFVSIAAKYAVTKYNLKRVLILDWDVHHGNGTQEIFNEDPNVLYISLHRYDNGEFFPHTGDGAATQVGRGLGEGFNVNIPWNKGSMGNGEYVAAFHQVVMPVAYQFNPELVLISAGFDASEGDPLGGCKVTAEMFGHMTHWLSKLAEGRVVLSLEGGYNVNSVAYSMCMCTKALLGDPLPPLREGTSPCPSAVESINNVLSVQAQYWSCLCENVSLPAENVLSVSPPRNHPEHPEELQPPSSKPRNDSALICGELMLGLSLSDGKASGGSGGSAGASGSGSGNEAGNSGSSQAGSSQPLTLRQFLTSDDVRRALVNEEMFAVIPLRNCPHLPEIQPVPSNGIDISTPCQVCNDSAENWICLVCYVVLCGRHVNEHMLMHNFETGHPLTISICDLSVWCYPCQSYVDNQALYEVKNIVHKCKFGVDMPWSYQNSSPVSPAVQEN